jgi:hypothetical protein
MTQKFYVEWIPDKTLPRHFKVKHYYEYEVSEIDVTNLPYFEMLEEYSEDFKYQESIIRSIRKIDDLYYLDESVLKYIKEYKNIKINDIREV